MLKINRRLLVCLLVPIAFAFGSITAIAQTPPGPQVDPTPVYTICTLLAGTNTAGAEAGGVVVTLSGGTVAGSKLGALQPAESVENLADLQEKLKAVFHLERISVISSYADMMSPGRQMILDGSADHANLRLVVTGQGVTEAQATPVTVHPGDGTSYTTTKPAMKIAGYNLVLTSGDSVALQKQWSVVLGTRSILARQVQLNGAIYFIVIATPIPGTPMKTSVGIESQAYRIYTDGTSGSGTASAGKGVGGGVGPGTAAGVSGSGQGIGQGVGAGTTQAKTIAPGTVRPPKLLYSVQPTLSPEARAGLKGPVILWGTLAADGTVQNIKVLKGVDGLNEIAIAAFKQWRYEPPPLDADGRPMAIQVTVVFPFADEPQ